MTDTTNGSKGLQLDPKWIESIYESLGALEMSLDADPLIFGPKRLNGKVAEARNMLQQCERIFLRVSHDLHRFSRALRVATTKLKLSKDYLFANDPETRAGRNVSDRESIATMKLSDQVKEVHRLEIATEDLKAVMDVVKAKRADLRDSQGRLRDQIRLCQEELGLGSRWGSRVPNAPDLDPSKAPPVETDDIDDMIAAVDGELHLPVAPEPSEDEADTDADAFGEDEDLLPNGLLCSVCQEPQYDTPAGVSCPNGHGGAPGVLPEDESEDESEDGQDLPGSSEEEPEGDLNLVLGATSSEDEVDSFLDTFDDDGGDESPASSTPPPEVESDLDFLLEEFGD